MTTKTLKPQRTCAGCFKKFNQDELLAVTRLKNGEVLVNADHKKAGRSVYLCRKMECLKKARDRKGKNGLEYGLKVKIPQEIWKELEDRLKKQ
jgi:predicted RNA-binding protein YlxR (DUF448 family)